MIPVSNISSVYFIGIGGIGMSALARYFHEKNIRVSGYDKTSTVLTQQLQAEGIDIHYTDDLALADKDATIVVYTPAIPGDHSELNYFMNQQKPLLKRSDALGLITEDGFNICIAGTHGKTTTSAMTAHILRHSGYGCNAFLGGISANYDTNFWSHNNKVNVTEADEYDRSFLKLKPDIAVITAMDADHLDIYGTEKNMQDAFISFTGKIKSKGLLIYKKGISRYAEFQGGKMFSYALNENTADAYAVNIRVKDGAYIFDATIQDKHLENIELKMGGMHNIENAIAAISISVQLGIDNEKIKSAIAEFKGVKRRFEYIIKEDNCVMIDDYAHHPEELSALIMSAKNLFPSLKCTVVFQPHLFSRTQDHAAGFAKALSLSDELILLPIYPARELPIEGVTSAMILEKVTIDARQLLDEHSLYSYLQTHDTQMLIMCGAGDIDNLVMPVKKILEKNK